MAIAIAKTNLSDIERIRSFNESSSELPEAEYALVNKRLTDKTVGSMFEGGSKVGATVESMLSGEQ